MQAGETIEDALKREVYEETGVTEVMVRGLVAPVLSKHRIPYGPGESAGLMLLVYEVIIPAASNIHLSTEHLAYEWVDRYEAAARLKSKYPAEFTDSLHVVDVS